ncbi:hypothetical protein RRF57_000235 [Xylaria bambusicola]|uniref:Uncharacterized protein n=1 Tax=Xylaria bambusicola TaxID=326684 RepID=A0AAN7U9H3_9PEZI
MKKQKMNIEKQEGLLGEAQSNRAKRRRDIRLAPLYRLPDVEVFKFEVASLEPRSRVGSG